MLKNPVSDDKSILLKHPKLLNRDQARSFSRMEVVFKFSYYLIPKDKFDNIEIDRNLEFCASMPVFMAMTVDISGGGIAYHTRKKVKKGDFLYLNFQQLSEEHEEAVIAECVWGGLDESTKQYLVRCRFYNITDTAQDTLMKFIYQMQRKAARKMKFAPKK